MAEKPKQYDLEYKIQAVQLATKLGCTNKAAIELGISSNTLYGWMKASKEGRLNAGSGVQTPQSAMTLSEEVNQLRIQIKTLNKENARLKKENAFLEEASAFFAASRLKSQKGKE